MSSFIGILRAHRARRHSACGLGRAKQLFLSRPVENLDFHGTLRAESRPYFGTLRAVRRHFACVLLYILYVPINIQ